MRRVSLPVVGDRMWTQAPRPRSTPARPLSHAENIEALKVRLEMPELEAARPKTRADCKDSPRPCPWVSCRYHLYLEVSANGWLKLMFPHLEVEDMKESCALDVADRAADDGLTLEQLGLTLNISLEGARQVELDVLAELRAKVGEEAVNGLVTGAGAAGARGIGGPAPADRTGPARGRRT